MIDDAPPARGALAMLEGVPNVARTAFWTAFCRAEETKREGALVTDPLAERLCGAEGLAIGRAMEAEGAAHASIVVRTRVIDERLASAIAIDRAEDVVLLGAGLDARAYRLAVPAGVRFVECDFEALLAWKRARIEGTEPPAGVSIERHALDLEDDDAVDWLLRALGDRARVVVLEGVLAYLAPQRARTLLARLAATGARTRVIADVGGGAWSALFGGRIRTAAAHAGAPFRTALADARGFFEAAGFRVESDISLVAWDAAHTERRFHVPWTTRLVRGVDDVARVIDAVPRRS